MIEIIDLILHVDTYLGTLITTFGPMVYAVLFGIIFCETGLVFLPFFPGDSLIFIAGAFAAKGLLDIILLFALLSIAAIAGDSVNYAIGKYFGEKVFIEKKLLKREHLDRTKAFFEKHGGKAIFLARFVPIIRTVAPFVAGVGQMHYPYFLKFNVIGGLVWVSLFLFSGYFLGSIPLIQDNMTLLILGIIIVSFIPIAVEYLREKHKK